MTYDHYNGAPPHQAHSDTSRAAAEHIESDAAGLRRIVLATIRAAGGHGATDEEVQDRCGMPGNTQRPRRRELEQSGLVRDSGLRRRNRSRLKAVVWIAVDAPPAGLPKERIETLADAVANLERWLASGTRKKPNVDAVRVVTALGRQTLDRSNAAGLFKCKSCPATCPPGPWVPYAANVHQDQHRITPGDGWCPNCTAHEISARRAP